MTANYRQLISRLGGSRVKQGEILNNYTTLKIGGPADLFFRATTTKDLILALESAKEFKISYFVMGGGTNILFSDAGFRGLIIKNETGGIKFKGLTGKRILKNNDKKLVSKVFLEVDSGVTINRLVRITVDQGLSGLENFLGQPGSVGGAMWINAHNIKSNNFFGDLVIAASVFSPVKGYMEVPLRYFKFSYDYSAIQKTKDIILAVTLELEIGNKDILWTTAKKALLYRNMTQPAGNSSAGCLFRNIDKSDAIRLATPNHTCSAGYLLDSAGMKGLEVGSVKLSEIHANFLINQGAATSSDVLELISIARGKVKQKFGIDLKTEVLVVAEK